jgi:hypothetical protein
MLMNGRFRGNRCSNVLPLAAIRATAMVSAVRDRRTSASLRELSIWTSKSMTKSAVCRGLMDRMGPVNEEIPFVEGGAPLSPDVVAGRVHPRLG